MAAQRELHDHFFKEAKRNGYRSRAAYKLIEIDDKKAILSKRDTVLDLGAAPGSWLQVAAERIGKRGLVVGVDLKPIAPPLPDEVITIEHDVNTLTPAQLAQCANKKSPLLFDVILSDMAPNTTGNRTIDHHGSMRLCHAAIDLSTTLLKPHGNLVMKVLEGEAYPELVERANQCFEVVKGFKPKASRAISTELFLICKHRSEEISQPVQIAPHPPTTGWS